MCNLVGYVHILGYFACLHLLIWCVLNLLLQCFTLSISECPKNRALNLALTVFLYTWVQVHNKTLWNATLWMYGAVWTTTSCKVNRKFLSELNWFCERTQKFYEGMQISLRENAMFLEGTQKFCERIQKIRIFFPPTLICFHHHVPLGAP